MNPQERKFIISGEEIVHQIMYEVLSAHYHIDETYIFFNAKARK